MTDLRTRFRALDDLRAPDLWAEIQQRAMAAEPRRTGTNRWVLIAVVALLLVAVAAVALVGSGLIKLPVVVDASVEPSATADDSALPSQTGSAAASETPDEQVPASWTSTGSMVEATRETATLLLNGQVLVTGGFGPIPDSPLAAADLYDPGSRTWSVTGSMVTPHGGHTATLLSDGTVLVAGGGSGSGPLASAELYDPGSGTWSVTADMVEGRGGHLATRLLDGTVLLAGGGNSPSLATAELYDPSSRTWSATGNMIEVRADATMTLLSDGRVLVAGGQFFGVGTAELYDPSSRTWTATASMSAGRIGHAAVLLSDGKVLVSGGYAYDRTGNNAIWLASAELYDPVSETWTATGSMVEARDGQTATLLADGTVLVAGGQSAFGNEGQGILATAELYDPISRTWTGTAEMSEARYGHMATLLLDGQVLVSGGGGTSASAELYRSDDNP
jgi:N-acetylneuraminic acid mutarotase